ncbi:MAG: TRAP transporter TatT component family protein [Polyangiales bacterium]
MCGVRFPRAFVVPFTLVFLGFSSLGCDLTGTLIKATVDGTAEFTEAHGTEFADPELVGPVMAAGIITGEGNLYYAPEYEPALLSVIFSNIAYGQVWLSAEANKAEQAGKYDEFDHLKKRSRLLFARALMLTKRMLRLRDDGFDEAMTAGIDPFKVWVDENFFEKEDSRVLLTAGMAYFVSILNSEEGLAASVDIPYARYMVERSVELDPKLQGAQGLSILGTYWCTVPQMVGGNPKLGYELMQRAMAYTNRQSHSIMISTAERCATALQDRKLYQDLLNEVIEAGDAPKYRLTNKMARRDAERLLKQIDDIFYD